MSQASSVCARALSRARAEGQQLPGVRVEVDVRLGQTLIDVERAFDGVGVRTVLRLVTQPALVQHSKVPLLRLRLSCTFEVDNLSDAPLHDKFGVQLPGRAFNLELNVQL